MKTFFKQLLSILLLGTLTLSFATVANAATKKKAVAKKSVAKKSVAKKKGKAVATSAAAPVIESAKSSTVAWHCVGGQSFHITGDINVDPAVTLLWQGRSYNLPRVATSTGAGRFTDDASGLDLVTIPAKAMLFNRNQGARLGDECKTAEMQAAGTSTAVSKMNLPASD